MNRGIHAIRSAYVPRLLAVMLTVWPASGYAQYIGLEPERIVTLLDDTAAGVQEASAGARDEARRVHLSASLLNEGKRVAALEALGPAGHDESPRLRYARVLIRLHAEREVRFADLRASLAALLQLDPFFQDEDAFDVWLGLNPDKKELHSHLAMVQARQDPRADWQRGEVLLRLDEPRAALAALERAGAPRDDALRSRVERALARAHFQAKDDAAGQAVYHRLLERLDVPAAERLFHDVAAIASQAERQEFATLAARDRAAFFRRFWASRHPVPVQELNPRLAEHYRRLAQALAEYPLQSTGRGFFTDADVFRSFSPKLPYFDPDVMFADGPASRYWLDPRGLLLIRHGEPDRRIPPRTFGDAALSESWLIGGYGSRPLFFHFVKRPMVGEWSVALNLAVAATRRAAIPDDPEKVLYDLTSAFVPLYQSRLAFHPLYQQVSEARSEADLGRLLRAESELMAAFLKAALTFDSTGYYTPANTLPLAVSVSNFYSGGRPALEVQFAADLSEVDVKTLGPASSLDATLMLYGKDWTTLYRRVDEQFPLERPASGKLKGFVGRLPVGDLEPEDYRLTLFIHQRESGRVGLARGRHEAAYIHEDSLGISDLFLFRQRKGKPGSRPPEIEAAGDWIPAPQRVVDPSTPFRLEFELYNLQPDASGAVRYEVEERVLTLYEEPGFLQKLAGYGNLAGQLFFPLYLFAGQTGAAILSQAAASETDGLAVSKRLVEGRPGEAITEDVKMDLRALKPGVYTVYVTVRDLRTGEITSRFLTLQLRR